jgi:hypothetical protein
MTMKRVTAIAISLVLVCLLAIISRPYWGQPAAEKPKPKGQPVIETPEPKTRPVIETPERMVPLKLDLPKPILRGTPFPLNEPNIAKERAKGQPRPVVRVPRGSVNLALKKPVTSNEPLLVVGEPEMVTDGNKSCKYGPEVDIGFGKKWVQIDLGAKSTIYAIAIWHYHHDTEPRAYRDVIVEVANDEDFEKTTIIYNNDHDNSYGMGAGTAKGWIERSEGKVLAFPKGVVARYVRLHSQGNTSNDLNQYVEVEVYGLKLKDMSVTTKPDKTKAPTRPKGK